MAMVGNGRNPSKVHKTKQRRLYEIISKFLMYSAFHFRGHPSLLQGEYCTSVSLPGAAICHKIRDRPGNAFFPTDAFESAEEGVLDEPYSQLSPLSGVAVQARQST
jgi:hypothetical protein